jgi:protein tyrosine phosphatase
MSYNQLVEEYVKLERAWSQSLEDLNETHESSINNPHKNRYFDIYACEATRVKLQGLDNDYINANFIDGPPLDGFSVSPCYISTQAPTMKTLVDFWHMVWQQDCPVIVMLTRELEHGVAKAISYWPKPGESRTMGPYKIVMEKEETLPYTIAVRRLTITASDSPSETRYAPY